MLKFIEKYEKIKRVKEKRNEDTRRKKNFKMYIFSLAM